MSKYKLELHYSVANGGDGSAYPQFSLSKELARIHQDMVNLNEGWGEPCTGSILLESDSEIKVKDNYLITKESLKEELDDMKDSKYYPQKEVLSLIKDLENVK